MTYVGILLTQKSINIFLPPTEKATSSPLLFHFGRQNSKLDATIFMLETRVPKNSLQTN
jgi:hypothetical protein